MPAAQKDNSPAGCLRQGFTMRDVDLQFTRRTMTGPPEQE
jgi:hypothetical protein